MTFTKIMTFGEHDLKHFVIFYAILIDGIRLHKKQTENFIKLNYIPKLYIYITK